VTIQRNWAIGIDLGGTKLEVAIIDENGFIDGSIRIKTRVTEGSRAVVSDMLEAIDTLSEHNRTNIVGIGVGTAGQINKVTGDVELSPNLGWRNIPLKRSLEDISGIPVVVTNDVRAITWGEWTYGAGKGIADLVCLFVGTGIGGGVVSGGRLLEGATNTAAELGHITVSINGPQCTCGNRGCLEALSGGWGIARRAQEAVKKNRKRGKVILDNAGHSISNISSEVVALSARSGDPMAISVLETATQALVAGCVSLVNAFNPRKLIIGGGVIDGIPELMDKIKVGIRELALPAATRELEVVKSALGAHAGVIGAASLAMDTFRTKKEC
jgi:glucokinase